MISSSIVIPPDSLLQFANPRIGYHSIIPDADITVSSELITNPRALLANYFTFDAWQATGAGPQWIEFETDKAEFVDYVAVASHNLATAQASFRVQYWDGGWVDAMIDYLPIYNSPIMFEFTPVLSNRFRFQIIASTVPVFIGVLFIGQIMHFERGVFIGHTPAPYNRVDDILNSQSEGGQFLGRSTISEGAQTTIDLNHLSSSWLRDTWVPFQDHARLKPFFFAWFPARYPYEIIYGWSMSSPAPQVAGFYWYSVAISMRGISGPVAIES